MQKGFIFDVNKCTGCNACEIACIIENELEFQNSWRKVNTFNENRNPLLPTFHLSMACNHCEDAPCMKYCPALAYSRDQENGAVLINQDYCIGCKYCSWVCPYDAPKFDNKLGIMTKCTFCNDRQQEGFDPACISICPTDALSYGDFKNKKIVETAGFTKTNISPSMAIIPLRKGSKPPKMDQKPYDDDFVEKFFANQKEENREKISLKSEWTLVTFTLLASFLVGSFSSIYFSQAKISPLLFVMLGIAGIGLSSIHLGKKFRAYRALLNWKNSWLSREIIFYSLFLFLSAVFLFIYRSIPLAIITSVFGFIALVSIDMVYNVLPVINKKFYHSASTLLTGIAFFTILSNLKELFIIILILKTILYLQRTFTKEFTFTHGILVSFRLLALAVSGIMVSFDSGLWVTLTLFTLGEVIDRSEFYNELKLITPKKQMEFDFNHQLNKFQ